LEVRMSVGRRRKEGAVRAGAHRGPGVAPRGARRSCRHVPTAGQHPQRKNDDRSRNMDENKQNL